MISISIDQSFWNLTQSMIVMAVTCTKFPNDWATENKLLKNEMWWDWLSWWFLERYAIYYNSPISRSLSVDYYTSQYFQSVNFPWVNSATPSDAYMHQWTGPALLQIMACGLDGAQPLSEPMLTYCQLDPKQHISMKFYLKFKYFHSRKCIWTCHLRNGSHFVQGEMS